MYCNTSNSGRKRSAALLWTMACLAILSLVLPGCQKIDLYEKMVAVKGGEWSKDQTCTYALDIPRDNMACWLVVSVRHTHLYPYRNLWIRLGLQSPGDSTYKYSDFNLALANNEKWLGLGMNDVYDRRIRLFDKPVVFDKAGAAAFSIQHIMREDPLPGVLHVGLRIEPAP